MTDENGIDVEARQKALIEKGLMGDTSAQVLNAMMSQETRTRAPSSDKGTKRPPKPAAAPVQAGAITEQAGNRLRMLLEDVIQAEHGYWDAQARRSKAMIEYNKFVDELKTTQLASLTAQGK